MYGTLPSVGGSEIFSENAATRVGSPMAIILRYTGLVFCHREPILLLLAQDPPRFQFAQTGQNDYMVDMRTVLGCD